MTYLVVSPRVPYNQEARLFEGLLDLVGEGARGELAGHRGGTNMVGKLENGTLQGTTMNRDTPTLSHHAHTHTHSPTHWTFSTTTCCEVVAAGVWCGHTCPTVLLDMTQMSAGFSMATMILAAISSFSHVFFKLKSGVPTE